MSLPFMPLYIPDYLADTAHLDALESGAYLHLIMHYWMNGGLPQDDRSLARIAKTTEKQWKSIRPRIEAFFRPGWRHGRIDREYDAAMKKQEKRALAGRAGNRARWGSRRDQHGTADGLKPDPDGIANGSQTDRSRIANGSQPEPEPEPKIDHHLDATGRLLTEVGKACGFRDATEWPLGWKDAYRRVAEWRERWPDDLIVMSVQSQMATKDDGPPSTVNYFEKGIAKAAMRRAKPLPTAIVVPMQEVVRVQQSQRPVVGEGIQRLRDRLGPDDAAAPDQASRPEQDRGVVEILPPRKAE